MFHIFKVIKTGTLIIILGCFWFKMEAQNNCIEGISLFKEDFGGNNLGDPLISTNPLPEGVCSYEFRADGDVRGAGRYTIRKLSLLHSWYQVSDHTYEKDDEIGYLMQVDASNEKDQQFYEYTIDDLCGGTTLYFSMWGVSVYKGPGGNPGRIKMVMESSISGRELSSQEIVMRNQSPSELINGRPVWEQFEFSFKLPVSETSVVFRLINNGTSSAGGNDFALDDIEIRLCVPPITLNVPQKELCAGSTLKITSEFTNDSVFTEPLAYKWLFSKTNEEDQGKWLQVGTDSPILDIPSLGEFHTGYYRLAIASKGSIDMKNCRSISEPVLISVISCGPIPEPTTICDDGTLIFREDFGGNSLFDPVIRQSSNIANIPRGLTYSSQSNYVFSIPLLNRVLSTYSIRHPYMLPNGSYSLVKKGKARNGNWFEPYDHTYPGNALKGYLMEVNGLSKSAIPAYYRFTLDNLCSSSVLRFSVWGMSISKLTNHESAKLKLVIKTPQGDIEKPFTLNNGTGRWEKYELKYSVPPGVTSLTFEIANNSDNDGGRYGYGNVFALDDIEVRSCQPAVRLSAPSSICMNRPERSLTITSEFKNDDYFKGDLQYRWYKSNAYGLNMSSGWTEAGENSPEFLIQPATPSDAGYYRLAISESGTGQNCRAISDPIHISVVDCDVCPPCVSSFAPVPGEKYVLSAWVKETGHGEDMIVTGYENSIIALTFENSDEEIGAMAEGAIIEGWQRIYTEFTVPSEAVKMDLILANTGAGQSFFDDIRVFPFNANMKSFVYDPQTRRLVAELDGENYATFYEYDEEGALIRVKKETEKGVMTIRETRQARPKSSDE